MKHFHSVGRFSLLSLLGGLTTAGLRALLYAVAVDGRGLLTPSHPLNLLCWLPGVAAVVLTALWIFRKAPVVSRRERCRTNGAGAAGCLCATVGIVVTVLTEPELRPDILTSIWRALGLAAGICLAVAAIRTVFGKKPAFLLHGVAALFFSLNLANQYRTWTQTPQFQDYGCAMLACVSLTMTAYYRASFELGGASRAWRFWNTLSGVFCLGALVHCHAPALYLGGALWSLLAGLPVSGKKAPRFSPDSQPQGEMTP